MSYFFSENRSLLNRFLNVIPMKKEIQDISRLIAAKILGQKLTGEELDKLDEWIKMSPENRELFERVENLEDVRKIIELEKEDYGSRAVSMFVEKQNKFNQTKN